MVTIKLKHPIQIGDIKTEELTFRKPVVADLLVMDEAQGDVDRQVRLIGALTDLPSGWVKKLDWEDFFAASEVVNGFLPDGQETGDQS